ncbi:glutaredoxin domain-containing protein [Psychrobium sp. 1_MG-2023]|uniref:glutaredoxin family protein n=1 Tax=Psychrobium sp. 1_MG-2023 TaxID=3062624 RepID=UPI000C334529|nr:glutaredoxin domain-containing protein [Psychrobium sp. 1_MG-2023]MDP2561443.1 glutathione S-transferase N-terminal domain-containing protein [Psychrobium sp. 1_MG-2023]PKF57710.1 NrdH-redoxin [Alteromonadales bacterium alter-6D02]
MAIVRWILGRIILLLDFIFSPRGVKRANEAQAVVDTQAQKLALYQFAACPFCVKVRRQMKRLSVNVELRDAKNDQTIAEELLASGGKKKVPCLRIEHDSGEVEWMYESSDINAYLTKRFSPESV